jgi:hypothetical protein
MFSQPFGYANDAFRQQIKMMDWSARSVVLGLFLVCQQIKQQCSDPGLTNGVSNHLIARAMTIAATAVHKQHDSRCSLRQAQIAIQFHTIR